jgi:hypothetical protein
MPYDGYRYAVCLAPLFPCRYNTHEEVVLLNNYKQNILEQTDQVLQWNLVELSDIPKIPLYMEQVTSFFDEMLSGARRNEDDKILTKTMINNYTKEGTLPRPNGKKYSREHMIRLAYIFLLKQVLSLQDVNRLFELLGHGNAEQMYGTYLEMVEGDKEQYRKNLIDKMNRVEEKLTEKGICTRENFEMMLILLTVTEATSGKMLMWKMLDQLDEERRMQKEAAKEKK